MNHLTKTIQHLRETESILLYDHLLEVHPEDEQASSSYLTTAYKQECLEYPYTAPPFEPIAALWAAKCLYFAAQLLLYRQNKPESLAILFPECPVPLSPSSILSADLSLRFMPDILLQLKLIDPNDPLIAVLEHILAQWHYSGIAYNVDINKLSFEVIKNNLCLQQLYMDRMMLHQKNHLELFA